MRMRAPLLALGALLGAARAAAPQAGIPPAGAAAQTVLRELDQLDTTITAQAWVRGHPGERIELMTPAVASETHATRQDWCARVTRRRPLPGGRVLLRRALFIVPDAPPGEALPADTTVLAARSCHLRSIWITVAGSDAALRELEDSVDRLAADRYGAGSAKLDLSAFGSAFWRGRMWRTSQGGVAVVRDSGRFGADSAGPAPLRAMAWIGADLDAEGWERAAGQEITEDSLRTNTDWAAADTAISLSGIGNGPPARLRRFLATWRAVSDSSQHPPVPVDSAYDARLRARFAVLTDSELLPAMTAWMAAVRAQRAMPPSRRAAGLLAADITLYLAARSFPMQADSTVRLRLQSLGAQYGADPLGAEYGYTRNLLLDAWRLDSLGRVGGLAFLPLLRTGFSPGPACGGGEELFRGVIGEGESWLRRNPASPYNAEVHALLGDAYATIVALADGAVPPEYAEAAKYQPERAPARAAALAHYRAALAFERLTFRRRALWRDAWRLLAGLTAEATFYCVYD